MKKFQNLKTPKLYPVNFPSAIGLFVNMQPFQAELITPERIEVKASGGETHVFRLGNILLASDLTGKGHVSRTLTSHPITRRSAACPRNDECERESSYTARISHSHFQARSI